jgi:hypothetical protein
VVHFFSHENFSVNASLTRHGNVSTLVTIKGEDVLSLDSIGATIAFVPNDAGSVSEATTYRLLMKGGLSYILNCTKAEKSVEAIIEN